MNTHPVPGTSRTARVPKSASIFCRAIASPNPRPVLSESFCSNGTNIHIKAPGSRPPQLSCTSIRTNSPEASALKVTTLFSHVNLNAQVIHRSANPKSSGCVSIPRRWCQQQACCSVQGHIQRAWPSPIHCAVRGPEIQRCFSLTNCWSATRASRYALNYVTESAMALSRQRFSVRDWPQ